MWEIHLILEREKTDKKRYIKIKGNRDKAFLTAIEAAAEAEKLWNLKVGEILYVYIYKAVGDALLIEGYYTFTVFDHHYRDFSQGSPASL